MVNNNRISKYTQLFSESILFYFILIPVFALTQYPYPFWNYILFTVLSIILFEVSLIIAKNYVIYIPVIAVTAAFMYFIFDFPVPGIVLWLALMTWRNAHMNIYGPSDNQMTVLTLTIILLFLGVIFFNHPNLIWIAIVQVITIVVGYWFQLLTYDGMNNNQMRTNITLGTFGIVTLAVGGLVYGIYPLLSGLVGFTMAGVGVLFKNMVFGIVDIGDWLGIDLSFLMELVNEDAFEQVSNTYFENMENASELVPADSYTSDGTEVMNWWTISFAIVAVLLIAVFLYRKKFADVNLPEQHDSSGSTVSVTPLQGSTEIYNNSRKPSFFTRSNNPIRKKVLKFEQKAYDKGLGRKSSETIEDWFARLDINPGHLDLYQKVRYGDKELTQAEKEQCFELLDELMERIDNR
ncbi:DUF4129 domain-containing protein [Virgibacillus doumboii]|uniref:DUF4129 domain-containing protein n=1 Tax=Virgibacillus doumboii TaxID=2697503 RepID=UPI0013DED46E|nr:DUF4129 domain-containing protein [Virgibacillus doumboii]